jgi:hypothetical protein
MSPKAKRELAREHLESAREALDGGRDKEALNALFYAAEAAIVALAEQHGLETRMRHEEILEQVETLVEAAEAES